MAIDGAGKVRVSSTTSINNFPFDSVQKLVSARLRGYNRSRDNPHRPTSPHGLPGNIERGNISSGERGFLQSHTCIAETAFPYILFLGWFRNAIALFRKGLGRTLGKLNRSEKGPGNRCYLKGGTRNSCERAGTYTLAGSGVHRIPFMFVLTRGTYFPRVSFAVDRRIRNIPKPFT